MTLPPQTPHGASTVLITAFALLLGTAPAPAQGLGDAACLAFEGKQDCRTVTVVDADACIVKLRPKPLPDLDPAIAGCLIDDIGTRRISLKTGRPQDLVVASDAGTADGTGARTTVRLSGPEIVHVLTAYDENGAPVWQPRDAATFEHRGDAARTRMALDRLSLDLCGQGTRVAAPIPAADAPRAGADAIPRAIGVNEAFRLSSRGEIVLIDVRLESEWRETGIAATAIPITMNQRREDFVQRLGAVAGAAGGARVALICARGERTAWLQRALIAYGFDGIIDVKGGMLGGNGAPGWIPAGLPVKPYAPGP